MGARWMQQKKAKMRRAYLKKVRDYGINRDRGNPHTFVNRNQAAQHLMLPDDLLSSVDNLIQNGIQVEGLEAKVKQGNPRAMALIKAWQSINGAGRRQGIDRYLHITLVELGVRKIRLFFSGDEYFFMEENPTKNLLRRSIVYTSRERAMSAFRYNRIGWLNTSEL